MEGILPPPGIRGALRLGAFAAHCGTTAGTLGHFEKLANGVSRPLEFGDHNHTSLGHPHPLGDSALAWRTLLGTLRAKTALHSSGTQDLRRTSDQLIGTVGRNPQADMLAQVLQYTDGRP